MSCSPDRIEPNLAVSRNYWFAKLVGSTTVPRFAPSSSGPAPAPAESAPFQLPDQITGKVLELSGGHPARVLVLLLAALEVCLYKYTGEEDIVTGTTVRPGQTVATVSEVVLPIRDRISGSMSARDVIEQARRTLRESFHHQAFPWRTLDVPLNSPAGLGTAGFGAAIVLSNISAPELWQRLLSQVTWLFKLTSNTISGQILYSPQFQSIRFISSLETMYARLLDSLLSHPDMIVAEHQCVSPAECNTRLRGFKVTGKSSPEIPVHKLFEIQAAADPDAIAVEDGMHQVTFAELNTVANFFARRLLEDGVSSDDFVGVTMEHSWRLIAVLLGVLKAGAAYVPLDPQGPVARNEFACRDAGIRVLVCDRHPVWNVPTGCVPFVIGSEVDEYSAACKAPLPRFTDPNSSAYLIYTSGSTGGPKGVQIAHGALANYVSWAQQNYLPRKGLAMALYSSIAFDLTVTSVFCPLASGNRIVVYAGCDRRAVLIRLFEEERVDVVKLTPSHLALVEDLIQRNNRIHRLVLGGEALDRSLVDRVWRHAGGSMEIVNEYGPTEATVGCTYHVYNPSVDTGRSVPIGRPIPNTAVYVVDKDMNLTPTGAPGELLISGAGLATAYWHGREPDYERFQRNPFANGSSIFERVYRTGDLVRWLPDQTLEYIGRVDTQIKYHGIRLEPEELRQAINRHPEVRNSAVALRNDSNLGEVLAAYYVASNEIPEADLRRVVADWLPEPCVPSLWIRLDEVPVTLSGKLNEAELPSIREWKCSRTQDERRHLNTTEQVVTLVWERLLGLANIDREDDFFQLGGHSLLFVRMASEVGAALNADISLSQALADPTVAGIARLAGRERGSSSSTGPITLAARGGPLPLSFEQEQIWLGHELDPETSAYSIYEALRVRGPLDLATLSQAITEVTVQHEVLRTTFPLAERGPVQLIASAPLAGLLVIDLSAVTKDDEREGVARSVATLISKRRFDLAIGPLFRATAIRVAENDHILVLALHHIVTDGLSVSLLLAEVAKRYAGRPPAPDPQALQYADYASWQRSRWTPGAHQRALEYWTGKLAGVQPLRFPERSLHKGKQQCTGISEIELEPQLTRTLRRVGRDNSATLSMVLLAGLNIVLGRLCASKDVTIAVSASSRLRPEWDRMLGVFVNLVLVRTRLEFDCCFSELVAQVRAAALEAYAHQEVPFAHVVQALRRSGESLSPLSPQAVFVFQSVAAIDQPLGNWNAEPFPVVPPDPKRELTFSITESSDTLLVSCAFQPDRFSMAVISALLRSFHVLLMRAAMNPRDRLSSLVQRTAPGTEGA